MYRSPVAEIGRISRQLNLRRTPADTCGRASRSEVDNHLSGNMCQRTISLVRYLFYPPKRCTIKACSEDIVLIIISYMRRGDRGTLAWRMLGAFHLVASRTTKRSME